MAIAIITLTPTFANELQILLIASKEAGESVKEQEHEVGGGDHGGRVPRSHKLPKTPVIWCSFQSTPYFQGHTIDLQKKEYLYTRFTLGIEANGLAL